MKGTTLRQRPFCGVAPRCLRRAPARPGIFVRVIVPSKDNASGSSDKHVPMLWTSLSGAGVLNQKSFLEEVYNRDAQEPSYRAPEAAGQPLDPQQVLAEHHHTNQQQAAQHQQQQLQGEQNREQNVEPAAPAAGGLREEDLAALELDPAALRERRASTSQASTSAPSAIAGFSAEQQGQLHEQLYAGSSIGSGYGAGLNGAAGGFRLSSTRTTVAPQLNGAAVAVSSGGRGATALVDPISPVSALGVEGPSSPQSAVSGGGGGHHHHDSHHHQQHAALNGTVADVSGAERQQGTVAVLSSPLAPHHHQQQHHQHHEQQHSEAQHQVHSERPQTHPQQQQQEHHQGGTEAAAARQQQQQLPLALNSLLGPPEGTLLALKEVEDADAAVAAVVAPTAAQAAQADEASPAASGTASASASAAGGADAAIPQSIWILCAISAALTCASCVFNTALPIYMVSELKMSMRSMGMFEGLLEAFSYVVRMCSGVVSDRMTSRKAAITLGFAAGAAAKFGMASAGTVGLLFAGKAVDRLANGIQAAPRDALIGDLSPPGVRSACFGLAQSLRKWGSAVGALAAFFLMKASNNNYQLIFYSAATVSLTACIAFVIFVPAHTRPPSHHQQQQQQQQQQSQHHHQQQQQKQQHVVAPPAAASAGAAQASPSSSPSGAAAVRGSGPLSSVREFVRSLGAMGADFYRMLGVISLYALGHVNESLLEARAMEVGFGKAEATLVVAAIAAVTFLTAFPLGKLDDKYGAGTTFAVGIGALIAGDLVLLLSGQHPMALFAACLFLGVHWAVIQGPLLSIVSGLAPAHLRGTAFGIFYTVMAFTAVAANTMYGSIWHTYGANAAFATSAALMTVVLAGLRHMLPASARRRGPAAAPTAPTATAQAPMLASKQQEGQGQESSPVAAALPAAA